MSATKPPQPDDKHLLERLYADPVALLANPAPTARQLAADALFVLDANVLLAPYKIGESQFGAISTIYRRLAKEGRLFTVAHAVREYLKNRQTAVAEAFNYTEQRLSSLPELSDFSLGLMEDTDEHKQAVEDLASMRAAVRKFRNSLGKIQDRLRSWAWDDPISTLYAEVFTGDHVVSPALPHSDLCKQFAFRVENCIPPGFNDASKPDDGIGDYLIWQSIIAIGVRHKQNVVFVTNDEKNDWSVRSQKTALLPVSELQSEFFADTGKHFGIMNFPAFLGRQGADAAVVERAQDAQAADDIMSVPMTATITRAGVYDALADLDNALDGLYRSLALGGDSQSSLAPSARHEQVRHSQGGTVEILSCQSEPSFWSGVGQSHDERDRVATLHAKDEQSGVAHQQRAARTGREADMEDPELTGQTWPDLGT